ncbi:MAG: Protein-glutamine gamma-glutamyltransferase [Firmicutes bacterium ADurb.Bin193]|nr:MAG: Protein-glutamine gamma-glutamyltransferase [Firmicutes bacterium ADurb.Bin193]
MITIGRMQADTNELMVGYPENSIERKIISGMSAAEGTYRFGSREELEFEVNLRTEIVNSAWALYRSNMDFAVFRESRCNPYYWRKTREGGFMLNESVSPYDAVIDIYTNGREYATECATAMIIVYYGALAKVYGKELFDSVFSFIHLMNWHYIDRNLKEIGYMIRPRAYLPGDRRYVVNPDVNPVTPEWRGENLIDLSDGKYYGHGIGVYTVEVFIRALNNNRREDADEEAYFMETAANPNYSHLYGIYRRYN